MLYLLLLSKDFYVRVLEKPTLATLLNLQVALYDYDTSSDAWTNTDVEGSLFLYERVVAPFHGFTISNRKQPNNHWEALNEHVEFQVSGAISISCRAQVTVR